MAITLIQGLHLTARDKQIISHMVAHGMTAATAPRAIVQLETVAAGIYQVSFQKTESDDWGRPSIRRQSALVICTELGAPSFADALALRDELRAKADATGRAIAAISGGGPMNLTPDHVKAGAEWRAADRAYKEAAAPLRAINAWLMRHYKAETRQREMDRRAARAAA